MQVSADQTPPAADPAPRPFLCPECKRALGTTDGRTLCVGRVRVRRPARLECRACGAARTWRPVGEGKGE